VLLRRQRAWQQDLHRPDGWLAEAEETGGKKKKKKGKKKKKNKKWRADPSPNQ